MFQMNQGQEDNQRLGNEVRASRRHEDDQIIRTGSSSRLLSLPTSISAGDSPRARPTTTLQGNDDGKQLAEQGNAQSNTSTLDSIPELLLSPLKLSTLLAPASSAMSPLSSLSPPLSPLVAGKTTRGRYGVWSSNEDTYVQYLVGLGITAAARLEKFNARFPGSHRTQPALQGRESWLRRHQAPLRQITKWSPEELSHLEKLVKDGRGWTDIFEEMEEKFRKGRTEGQYRSRVSKLGYNTSKMVRAGQPRRTEEESDYLKSLRETLTPFEDCIRLLKERFGVDRSTKGIRSRCALKGWVSKNPKSWTQEELEALWEWSCPASDLPRPEVFKKYWDRFGSDRSARTIDGMMSKMRAAGGIPTSSRTWDPWTTDEEEFLRNWPGSTARGCYAAYRATFGDSRSGNAIRSKFTSLREDKGEHVDERGDQ